MNDMKKGKRVALAVLLAVWAAMAICALVLWLTWAKDDLFLPDGLEYDLNEDKTGYIVSGLGGETASDIVIPATYKEKPVVEIRGFAFEDEDGITSVTLPASVTRVGSHAFYDCDSLTHVTLAEDSALATIGSYAFDKCSSLTSMTLPASVTEMGMGAFQDCAALTEVTFAEQGKLAVIPDYAFSQCERLETVALPAEGVLDYIGEWAFYGCESLASVTVPASVTEIGRYAFRGCAALAEFHFAEGSLLENVWDEALADCTSLTAVTLPDRAVSLYRRVFRNCTSLTAVTIPNEGSFLYGEAFAGCTSLETLTVPYLDPQRHLGYYFERYTGQNVMDLNKEVPASLKTVVVSRAGWGIDDYAFLGCKEITSVTLPAGITYIGYGAFSGCESLREIRFGGTVAEWRAIDKRTAWRGGTPSNLVIRCADGNYEE